MKAAQSRINLDENGVQHQLEADVRKALMSEDGLDIASLVVRRMPDGVCLEGVVRVNSEDVDVCRSVRNLDGIGEVLNHLVVCWNCPEPSSDHLYPLDLDSPEQVTKDPSGSLVISGVWTEAVRQLWDLQEKGEILPTEWGAILNWLVNSNFDSTNFIAAETAFALIRDRAPQEVRDSLLVTHGRPPESQMSFRFRTPEDAVDI